MWSLPDIKEMNERKVKELQDRKKGLEQKSCGHCNKKAEIEFEYYDIFSDTPCHLDLCEDCMGTFEESGNEGYFYCDKCDKQYISNITWENYFVPDEETGELICLNCKTKDVFSNPVGFEDIKNLSFEQLRKAPHVIGVGNDNMKQQIIKWGYKELGSVTADSLSGGLVTGFTSSSGQKQTMEAFNEFVKENGYTEFVIGLDGAYQFAVNISLWGR